MVPRWANEGTSLAGKSGQVGFQATAQPAQGRESQRHLKCRIFPVSIMVLVLDPQTPKPHCPHVLQDVLLKNKLKINKTETGLPGKALEGSEGVVGLRAHLHISGRFKCPWEPSCPSDSRAVKCCESFGDVASWTVIHQRLVWETPW